MRQGELYNGFQEPLSIIVIGWETSVMTMLCAKLKNCSHREIISIDNRETGTLEATPY